MTDDGGEVRMIIKRCSLSDARKTMQPVRCSWSGGVVAKGGKPGARRQGYVGAKRAAGIDAFVDHSVAVAVAPAASRVAQTR